VRATNKAKVPEGKICEVRVNRKSLLVANVEGKPCVISNICTHERGRLGRGVPDGTVATCPWHHWMFDVVSGKLLNAPGEGVKNYPAEVRGEDILVDLD
jgi:nitrite reductase/ring-hydroxylating ferredoxin subunit